MDVLTRLINAMCPNYTKDVWNEVKKDRFAVKAEWQNVHLPKLALKWTNIYLEGTILNIKVFSFTFMNG